MIKHWPGRTVTEADDVLFSMLTMNHHPLHSDAQYAAATQFGQRVVPGPFVFSLVIGMTVPVISGKAIANLSTTDMVHSKPVFHGDTIYAVTEVLDVRESRSQPDSRDRHRANTGINQRDETVIAFTRQAMIPKRPTA